MMNGLFAKGKIVFGIMAVCAAIVFSCASPPPPVIPMPSPKLIPYMIFVRGGVPAVGDEREFNAIIRARAVERYAEFENAAKKTGTRIEIDSEPINEGVKELLFNISWKAGRSDWDYISILVTSTWRMDEDYTKSGSDSFTWDVNKKTLLSVYDILPWTGFDSLAALSRFAEAQLRKKLDPQNKDAALQKIIERETAPDPENYSVFLLEKDSVTFYFNGTVFWENGTAEPQSVKIFKDNS
jgi:hypothetical protein